MRGEKKNTTIENGTRRLAGGDRGKDASHEGCKASAVIRAPSTLKPLVSARALCARAYTRVVRARRRRRRRRAAR